MVGSNFSFYAYVKKKLKKLDKYPSTYDICIANNISSY